MGNCLPRFHQWRNSRPKPRTSSTATSTTSQLPPPVAASSRKSGANKAAPVTDPNFDLLSPSPLHPLPAQQPPYGVAFTATFSAPHSSQLPVAAPPARSSHRRKHRKTHTTSIPSKRPSTPNPFDGLAQPPLTIVVAVHPGDPFHGLPGPEGPLSVSHVSKNGVSFFPHYSINYEGKEADDEGEESVGAEGEEEKSRLSSTEMDDDISIRYTTPTMASNHIVRPLPSPSSLSVPQPSIGSGINSSEHSIVHSTIQQSSSAYRQKSLTSTSAFHFPPVFSPPSAKVRGEGGDIYSDSETASTSPMSGHPQPQSAASPPSTTSPLTHPPQPPPFSRPHDPPAASLVSSHTRIPSHAPTTSLHSPPPPTADHLTLNTNAVALASQLFDDNDLFPPPSSSNPPPSTTAYSGAGKQRSPRNAMQARGGPPVARGTYAQGNSLSPHSAGGTGEGIGPALTLHRLSSQPQASDPLHPTTVGGGQVLGVGHSLSVGRLSGTTPRSPMGSSRGSGGRRRGEEEGEEGEGVEGKEDEEDSGTRSRDSKSKEENSRVRGVGTVRT